ncbi:MAG: hypothetical protein ABJH98_17795 [Reichenbachiella sp.]
MKTLKALSLQEKERLIIVQNLLIEKLVLHPEKLTVIEYEGLKRAFGEDLILPILKDVDDNRDILQTMISDQGLNLLTKE